MRGVFITASDTGAGKTFVGTLLVRLLRADGYAVAVSKPVESGCVLKNGRLVPQDALLLQHAANNTVPLETVCPFAFAAPLAPPLAAPKGNTLSVATLVAAVRTAANNDYTVVEGAGGILSPITDDACNSTLINALELPAICVVPNRLGAVNQARSAIAAAHTHGVPVIGIVLNMTTLDDDASRTNDTLLRRFTDIPIAVLPFAANIQTARSALTPIYDDIARAAHT